MPRKTATFLVLMLAVATVRPIACAWWCAPGETAHASCHEPSSTAGEQFVTGSSCDIDVLDTTATLTKTASLERVSFIPVPSGRGVDNLLDYVSRIAFSPPLRVPHATARPLAVLRI